jgi:hypothetical protein
MCTRAVHPMCGTQRLPWSSVLQRGRLGLRRMLLWRDEHDEPKPESEYEWLRSDVEHAQHKLRDGRYGERNGRN